MEPAKAYVEARDGGYYLVDSRVSLESIVYSYLGGESPAGIVESFPALTLEQAFGALAFYLADRASVDEYLTKGRAEFALMREESRMRNPALYAKLSAARDNANQPVRPHTVVEKEQGVWVYQGQPSDVSIADLIDRGRESHARRQSGLRNLSPRR